MSEYWHVPDKFIRKLARKNDVKIKQKQTILQLTADLERAGHQQKLEYLEQQFAFTIEMSALTICKSASGFPDSSRTAEAFIQSLVERGYITEDQVGTEWEPSLSLELQLCGISVDGSHVYLNIVEQKSGIKRELYSRSYSNYASISSAVIHFTDDEVFELRGLFSGQKKHGDFIMKLLGYGQPYNWFPVTRCTKAEFARIAQLLGASLSSKQVAIPSTVGSFRLNAKDKQVDLRNDPTCDTILSAIESTGLPTDDTMDETCTFVYVDAVTGIEIPVSFEMNLKSGSFRFKTDVTETVIDKVMEAFIRVCHVERQQAQQVV